MVPFCPTHALRTLVIALPVMIGKGCMVSPSVDVMAEYEGSTANSKDVACRFGRSLQPNGLICGMMEPVR